MGRESSNLSKDIASIQRQMAQIRHDMHHEVQGAVEGAQSLTDWRTLIRMNPWISLGIAATVGYLIVPKRRRETPTIVSVDAAPERFARSAPASQPAQARRSRWSTFGTVFSLAAPVLVRAAQNYALQHVEQWLTMQPTPSAENGRGRQPQSNFAKAADVSSATRFRSADPNP